MKPTFITVFFVLTVFFEGFAQTSTPFAFEKYVYDPARESKINQSLDAYAFEGDDTQKRALLRSFIKGEIVFTDYVLLVNALGYTLSQKEKESLFQRIDLQISSMDSSHAAYQKDLLEFQKRQIERQEVIPEILGEENHVIRILDFEKDGRADMLLFPRIFFGPSPGYIIYAYQDGKFKEILNNLGEFVVIQPQKKQLVLRYMLLPIEMTECEIIQTFVYSFKNKHCITAAKQYYARETFIPPSLLRPSPFKLTRKAALRISPKIDDSPKPRDEEGNEYYIDTLTHTLRGNIVAEIGANSEGFILGKEDNWLLVAFKPDSKIIANSLKHGMDSIYFDESGTLVEEPLIKPYLCGWIEKKTIQK